MIPADRLKCLEDIAVLARDFAFYRAENAKGLGYSIPISNTFHKIEGQLEVLESLWNIPPRELLPSETPQG